MKELPEIRKLIYNTAAQQLACKSFWINYCGKKRTGVLLPPHQVVLWLVNVPPLSPTFVPRFVMPQPRIHTFYHIFHYRLLFNLLIGHFIQLLLLYIFIISFILTQLLTQSLFLFLEPFLIKIFLLSSYYIQFIYLLFLILNAHYPAISWNPFHI